MEPINHAGTSLTVLSIFPTLPVIVIHFISQNLEKGITYPMMSIKVNYDFRQVSGYYEEHNYLREVRYTKKGMLPVRSCSYPDLCHFKFSAVNSYVLC